VHACMHARSSRTPRLTAQREQTAHCGPEMLPCMQ